MLQILMKEIGEAGEPGMDRRCTMVSFARGGLLVLFPEA